MEGIAHVVNYDMPAAPEDFIHRVGRTGRAGTSGTASTFGTRADRMEMARIERALAVKVAWRDAATGAAIEEKPSPVVVMPAATSICCPRSVASSGADILAIRRALLGIGPIN